MLHHFGNVKKLYSSLLRAILVAINQQYNSLLWVQVVLLGVSDWYRVVALNYVLFCHL